MAQVALSPLPRFVGTGVLARRGVGCRDDARFGLTDQLPASDNMYAVLRTG